MYANKHRLDVAVLVEAWPDAPTNIQSPSRTVSSPTLTDPDVILPDQSSWLPPSSFSQPSYSMRSSSPVLKGRHSTLPAVAPTSVLGPKTPSLSSTIGLAITPKEGKSHCEDTLGFSSRLREKSQHKTSIKPEAALERRLSDGTMSIRTQDLDNVPWPGIDSDSADGASIFLEEDTGHEGNNIGGELAADQHKLAESKRGTQWDEEPDLHAAMSQRADLILANAKKKLSLMEDNLRRTRRSLDTPRVSLGSLRTTSSGSEDVPTPGSGFSERLMYAGFSFALSRKRLLHFRSHSSLGSSDHLRGVSESTIPTVKRGSLSTRNSSADEPRAATANESRNAYYSGPRLQGRIIRTTRSEESMLRNRYAGCYTPLGRSADPEESPVAGLTPLREDDLPAGEDPVVSQFFQLRRRSRTRSMTQTSDLREQMRELQGRITSLQRRTREDGLRRRSQQNLRQTTPVAAAEAFESGVHAKHARGFPGHEHPAADETGLYYPGFAHHTDAAGLRRTPRNDGTDSMFVIHIEGNDDGSGYEHTVEYGALPTVEERHENRSDAFDYERSFLHSGMGSYSQPNDNRRDSISSTDSADTTNCPAASNEQHFMVSQPVQDEHDANGSGASGREDSDLHFRSGSAASGSTLASFITAVSGYSSARAFSESSRSVRNEELADASSYPSSTLWSADDVHRKSLRVESAQSNYSSTSDLPTPTLASFTTSTESSSDGTIKQRPASFLFSQLVGATSQTALAAALSSEDKDLVYAVAESLHQVCVQLLHNAEDRYGSRVWRRRLDEARKVLEGDGEED